ncbi:MAG: DUF493 domain-containing protein [Smithellaceae bacterium]
MNKMCDHEKVKLKIQYPASWVYKIIGPDPDVIRQMVADLIRDRQYLLTVSRESATAKYTCLNLEIIVESESHRLSLYESLKGQPCVKMVL